jgi:hypothetical protein
VAGEPTFVAGNPGSTERQLTVSQLETQRDLTIPVGQLQRSELRGRLIQFGEESVEHKRIANQPLAGVENSYKVFFGRQFVLADKTFMDAKRAQEDSLRAKVAADPKLAAQTGDAWGQIAAAQKVVADKFILLRQMETSAGGGSDLFGYARTLVRAAQERAKPTAERLPEYGDTRLALLEKRLLDVRPVDAPLEQLYLEHWLLKTREYLTADDPRTKLLLGKESPEGLSARLVAGSKLADPVARKALWDGGLAAIKASDDPMIKFVLAMDAAAREVRKSYQAEVTAPVDAAAEKIAKARFAVLGDSVYPGRDLQPAPVLRQGRRLDPARAGDQALHHLRGLLRSRHRRRTVRRRAALDRREGQAEPQHGLRLRHHQRHHRRQFRLAGDRRQGPGDRRGLRRQHPLAGRSLWL